MLASCYQKLIITNNNTHQVQEIHDIVAYQMVSIRITFGIIHFVWYVFWKWKTDWSTSGIHTFIIKASLMQSIILAARLLIIVSLYFINVTTYISNNTPFTLLREFSQLWCWDPPLLKTCENKEIYFFLDDLKNASWVGREKFPYKPFNAYNNFMNYAENN